MPYYPRPITQTPPDFKTPAFASELSLFFTLSIFNACNKLAGI